MNDKSKPSSTSSLLPVPTAAGHGLVATLNKARNFNRKIVDMFDEQHNIVLVGDDMCLEIDHCVFSVGCFYDGVKFFMDYRALTDDELIKHCIGWTQGERPLWCPDDAEFIEHDQYVTLTELKELRKLVTENSGAELSIREGYDALLSCIEQAKQDRDRARGFRDTLNDANKRLKNKLVKYLMADKGMEPVDAVKYVEDIESGRLA